MSEITNMAAEKLIRASDARRAILKAEPRLAYCIDNIPGVEAAPVVHGRWIHPKGYVVSNGFKCSECGHEEVSYYPINPRPGGVCIADENGNFYYPPKMNYCPSCGAKMMVI